MNLNIYSLKRKPSYFQILILSWWYMKDSRNRNPLICDPTWSGQWWVQRVGGKGEREREIKFIGLFEDRGHRGPYTCSPYKPFNHNLYTGIIIFPHIDNPQSTGYNQPKKKTIKIINEKMRAPLIWQIIGEKDSGSVYMWI